MTPPPGSTPRAALTAVLAVALLGAAGRASATPAPEDEGKDPGPGVELVEPRRPFDPAAAAARAEAEAETDVTHYRLEIEVIPEPSLASVTDVRVEGVSTIDFAPTSDGLTTFTVDLHSALTVDAVTGDVAGWSRVGDTVEIALDRAYDTGEPVQVAIDYGGYPPDGGYGAFRWWLHAGGLAVATLSQPYYAHYWWPCKDALDDKATMEMIVTVPDPLLALSNGVEVAAVPVGGGRTEYRWHETHPMIPYLASLAISDYRRYDNQYDYDDGGTPASMGVPCYVYPDHWDGVAGEPLPSHKSGCDELVAMLETFADLFGEYPFVDEKYGVVETGGSGGLSASMEHQTLSSLWRVDNYRSIMAHEAAHQWWGDEVTCETWYDIWLNEAFASYAEPLYLEFRAGGFPLQYWTRMEQRRPADPDGQVYRTSVGSVSAIFSANDVYNKGAWVLHMLRHVMGDGAFFKFLADYRANFADDSVTTDELEAVLSASFGEDLGWFVDEWVRGPGSPDYAWAWEHASVAGNDVLRLKISQQQDLDGFALFTMPIDVRVTTGSGATTYTVWNDDWDEYYALPLDGAPLSVELDAQDGVASRNWILFDSLAPPSGSVDGPPILLSADVTPPPGGTGPTTVVLVFSEDIGGFDASDVALVGSVSGSHGPYSVNYDAGTQTATLLFAGLGADDYALTVFDDAVAAHALALDGEVDDSAWWDGALLPSGDGQPGGDAQIAFSIPAPLPSGGAAARTTLAAALALLAGSALRRARTARARA